MNFPIKPPLYAIDELQINDLLMVSNVHSNIGLWLQQVSHFPYQKSPHLQTFPGIMLFERFTPWADPWADDYTTKLFSFYYNLAASRRYNEPYFNGYGLLETDYGGDLTAIPVYVFNIPNSITLSNNLPEYTVVTYLQRNYTELDIWMSYGRDYLDFYSKRRIVIPPFSTIEFSTENVLFCSMVVSGLGNQTAFSIGIPDDLNYELLDIKLQDITDILENEYPYLNKCIRSIDYEITCISEVVHNSPSNKLDVNGSYRFNWVENSLSLRDIPEWYHEITLLYANNDLWEHNTPLKQDMGLDLNVYINTNGLTYDFLHLPEKPDKTSDWIIKQIIPDGMPPIISTYLESIEFLFRDGIGVCEFTFNRYRDENIPQPDRFFPGLDTYSNELAYVDDDDRAASNVVVELAGDSGYTNSKIGDYVDRSLFSSLDGLVCGYNSLILNETNNVIDISEGVTRLELIVHQGITRFFYDVTFDITTNYYQFYPSVEEQSLLGTNTGTTSTDWSSSGNRGRNIFNVGAGGFRTIWTNGSLNGVLDPSNQEIDANFIYTNTLNFSLYSSDPKVIRNNTDQELIDFVDNIINEIDNYTGFMPDSKRVIEIHEALNAGKFANDPLDPDVFRFANLGYYIERIARILGISVEPDGAIRSIRQREFKESGDVIPPGWSIGQWGRNQGGTSAGQKGGESAHDKDGVAYPVISNKFETDPFSGEPSKIGEGGYVLCENLIQYLETFKDDLDKALGLQYAGANSFPLVNGEGDVSYEGLSVLVQENSYMLSELSKLISSTQISSLVTQAIAVELLAHCGVPTTVKELEVQVGKEDKVFIPYPALNQNSPSQFDQTLWLLSNISPLLAGKITIRQDKQEEGEK